MESPDVLNVCSLEGGLGRGLQISQSQQGETNATGNGSWRRAVAFPAGFGCEGGSFFSWNLMTGAWLHLGVWVSASVGCFSPINDISFYAINVETEAKIGIPLVRFLFCSLGFFFVFSILSGIYYENVRIYSLLL